MEGSAGRDYANKYLTGAKKVDTAPTTVVEFDCPSELIRSLFARQQKNEDGCMSHGLGNKAGKDLEQFNASLRDGTSTWRIVNVKRRLPAK